MLMIVLFALTAGTRAANPVKLELYDGLAVNDNLNDVAAFLVNQKVLTKSINPTTRAIGYNNRLTTIDVTNLAGLKYLCCYCNNIKGAGLEALLNSLPDRTSDDLGDLQFIWVDNDQNYCTPRLVEIAKAKNWKVSNIQGAEYPGAEVVPGDANCDSVVNADDIVILCQYLLGIVPECFEAEAADFNDDGDVNIEDITEIINTIVSE